jgi:hypothetical protein
MNIVPSRDRVGKFLQKNDVKSFERGRNNTFNLAHTRPTCSCTMPLPTEPISMNIVARNTSMANALLTYPVDMEDKDNVTILTLGDDDAARKVSPMR